MSTVRIEGTGTDVDLVVANLREKLDEQFGPDGWHVIEAESDDDSDFIRLPGWEPVEIDIRLSPGGAIAHVRVALVVEADRLSTLALPRRVRA